MFATLDEVGKTNFSSIEGNRCENGYYTANHEGSQSTYVFEYCNFLKNFQEDSKYGAFSCNDATFNINNCCFFGDLGKGKLFCALSYGIFNFKYCHIDNCTTYGPVNTNDEGYDSESSLNSLTFLSSFLCEANISAIYSKLTYQSHEHKGHFNDLKACSIYLYYIPTD